jgi:hypothetical protein
MVDRQNIEKPGVLCQDRDQGYDALEMFARMVQRLDETDK